MITASSLLERAPWGRRLFGRALLAAALLAAAISPPSPAVAEADGGVEEAKGPSLGLGGIGRLSANRLSIEDKQKRNVLRVRNVRASINLRAMREGVIRIPKGHLEGNPPTMALVRGGHTYPAAAPPWSHPSAGQRTQNSPS